MKEDFVAGLLTSIYGAAWRLSNGESIKIKWRFLNCRMIARVREKRELKR